MPCARCLNRDEVLAQDQLVANDTVGVIDHPTMGSIRIIKAPPKFGGRRLQPGTPSPGHGEHTKQVLESFQMDAGKVEALVTDGVVS